MTRYTIVVDREADWRWDKEGLEVTTVDAFLDKTYAAQTRPPGRIINLCRRYVYLSAGYYCSLLSEARGQLPMPTVSDIVSLSRKKLYEFAIPELDQRLRRIMRRLAEPPEASLDLMVYFGRASDPRFARLAAEAFDVFRYPVLRLRMTQDQRWRISKIESMGVHQVPVEHEGIFIDALRAFAKARIRTRSERPTALYSLAILHDPEEQLPPSDPAALDAFVRSGRTLGVDVEFITKRDIRRIPEFDALFIRATTAIGHYTFDFAKKAENEGIPVIDDTTSILRCTNKVFLDELLTANNLPTPRSQAVDRRDFDDDEIARIEEAFGYPVVLKIPDGSFSRGVMKAENREELRSHALALLAKSRIILAQEYMYTAFDWRIGVLNGEPLFACQYNMSRGHWQIYKHKGDGTVKSGSWRTMAVEQAPRDVVETATRAAALIGNGLYGIDLKQSDKGVFIIEVNDNPNIDHEVEDQVMKGQLYEKVLREFIRRIEKTRGH